MTVHKRLHCRTRRNKKLEKFEELQTLHFPESRDLRSEAH